MFLSDVPTAPPVNPAFLTPPPVTSVTDFAFNPQPIVVKLPSLDAQPTFSKTQLALIAGAALLALYTLRGK